MSIPFNLRTDGQHYRDQSSPITTNWFFDDLAWTTRASSSPKKQIAVNGPVQMSNLKIVLRNIELFDFSSGGWVKDWSDRSASN